MGIMALKPLKRLRSVATSSLRANAGTNVSPREAGAGKRHSEHLPTWAPTLSSSSRSVTLPFEDS